jgi:hypothetical protein
VAPRRNSDSPIFRIGTKAHLRISAEPEFRKGACDKIRTAANPTALGEDVSASRGAVAAIALAAFSRICEL